MARRYTKRQTKPQTTLGATVDCAALYLRVSTELQADEGYSLADQDNRLRAYCTSQGWTVCEQHIYTDAISGKSTDRPEYQRMLVAIEAGEVRRLVVTKLDRVSRNTKDFLSLLDYCDEHGCSIVSIAENFDTSTDIGRAVVTILMTFAELERKQIAARVTSGRKQKATQGGWNGGRVPFGYNHVDGDGFAINTDEAAIVRRIFSEFNAPYNRSGLQDIAKGLNGDELPTQRGGKWYASTVRYILSNGFYAGLMQYDGQEPVTGEHQAIITKEAYNLAQSRLDALRPGPVR